MPKTKNQNFSQENIRQAAVAGQFYPEDKAELNEMLDDFLQQAETAPSTSSGQVPQIIIVPHAGYVYSGKIAAAAFKQLQNFGFQRAVLIGQSHQQFFSGVAADEHDIWQSPLADFKVDKEFIQKLAQITAVVVVNSEPHKKEHSLEVMLPFLAKVLSKDIKIVPLLFGSEEQEASINLAQALSEIIDDKTVVVISSDLSHYPDYETANNLDKQTIESILSADITEFKRTLRQIEQSAGPQLATLACAEQAIALAIVLARKLELKPRLLEYANSGDAAPETKDRVVGYAAIGFYPQNSNEQNGKGLGFTDFTDLNKEEQKVALQIARKALDAAFNSDNSTSSTPNFAVVGLPPIFQEKRGVFVTLHKNGNLRGCIGNFTPDIGLAENIKEMALSAAFNDPRFAPLQEQELKDLAIEISVLSAMQKIANSDLIEIGKHGVYIKKGQKSGVYLPQVATELGWTKEQFLDSLCQEKAGLPADCWKDSSTELFIFTAQVFSEK